MEKVNIKERSWRKAEVYSNEAKGIQIADSLDPFLDMFFPQIGHTKKTA
jgi:hypothetical protein